jgi:hypothetical protein
LPSLRYEAVALFAALAALAFASACRRRSSTSGSVIFRRVLLAGAAATARRRPLVLSLSPARVIRRWMERSRRSAVPDVSLIVWRLALSICRLRSRRAAAGALAVVFRRERDRGVDVSCPASGICTSGVLPKRLRSNFGTPGWIPAVVSLMYLLTCSASLRSRHLWRESAARRVAHRRTP